MSDQYDRFIEIALRRAQPEFSYITLNYALDFPAELTWILVRALVTEQGLTVGTAAQAVLNFCERRGSEIPSLINRSYLLEPTNFCQ